MSETSTGSPSSGSAHMLRNITGHIVVSLVGLSLMSLTTAACGPSCERDASCEGNAVRSCSVGPDQLAGSPSFSTRTCDSPNPVCVETGSRDAACYRSKTACTESDFVDRCEDGVAVTCSSEGLVVGKACTETGNVCDSASGRCVFEKFTACDGPDKLRCEGDRVIRCMDGAEQADDCPESSVCRKEPSEVRCARPPRSSAQSTLTE